MAQYKVPQDVEAEDKLIGPFSFRQFVYLGVAALGMATAFGLWQIFPGLIIITFPVIILFLALALPLRKDQPMETYLTAVIRFYVKPRKRLWQPDGSIGLVTIVAPKMSGVQLTKSVGGTAAAEQLSYLSQVVDTQGWATRGVISPTSSMNDTAYAEAQQAEDVLDENAKIAKVFESMIDKTSSQHKQTVADRFRKGAQQPVAQPPQQTQAVAQPQPSPTMPDTGSTTPQQTTPAGEEPNVAIDYNPYPSSMRQHILNPLGNTYSPPAQQPAQPAPQPIQHGESTNLPASPSDNTVSPDIMRLANNNDLSISALANEAHRIHDRDNEEVIINLH